MIVLLRWVVAGMTGVTIARTVWEAATGGGIGVVLTGLAVSVGGVFLVALWGDYEERRRYERP